MIVRLVTMTFPTENIPSFLKIFSKYENQIKSAQGCISVQLIQNVKEPEKISTLSYWDNEDSLNAYRASELFAIVWPQTKKLFSSSAMAVTYTVLPTFDLE